MRFEYRNDTYYHDCCRGDILICFIDRDYHTFTLADYPTIRLADYQNFKSSLYMAVTSYTDVRVSPSEMMLRIITSLVLL